jgi:hypothetical protein
MSVAMIITIQMTHRSIGIYGQWKYRKSSSFRKTWQTFEKFSELQNHHIYGIYGGFVSLFL